MIRVMLFLMMFLGLFQPISYGASDMRTEFLKKPIALVIENGQKPESVAQALRLLQEHEVKATFSLSDAFIANHKQMAYAVMAQGHQVNGLTGISRGIDTSDWMLANTQAVVERVSSTIAETEIITIKLDAKVAVAALPAIIKEVRQEGYHFVLVSQLPARVVDVPSKPEVPGSLQPRQSWQELRERPLSTPAIALTFDDGGNEEQVVNLLNVLRENKVRSTFFLIGSWMSDHPSLVRRIVAEGHELANHSYNHPEFTYLSYEQIQYELTAWQMITREITGQEGRLYFRPPYGDYNNFVSQTVRDAGLQALIMWSVDSRDWTGVASSTMAERVLEQTRNGSVILFHLHGRHTPSALEQIIPFIRANGYQMVTISEMLHNP